MTGAFLLLLQSLELEVDLERYLSTAGAGGSMLLRVCVLAINKKESRSGQGEFITILHSELAEEE